MQLEVILPLVAYLVVVFGISVYAMRKLGAGADPFVSGGMVSSRLLTWRCPRFYRLSALV